MDMVVWWLGVGSEPHSKSEIPGLSYEFSLEPPMGKVATGGVVALGNRQRREEFETPRRQDAKVAKGRLGFWFYVLKLGGLVVKKCCVPGFAQGFTRRRQLRRSGGVMTRQIQPSVI
jgi:hypothetical protein